jgi:hypothetical protein
VVLGCIGLRGSVCAFGAPPHLHRLLTGSAPFMSQPLPFPGGQLLTVFSAPDYPQFQVGGDEDRTRNKAAAVRLERPGWDEPSFVQWEAALPRPKVRRPWDFTACSRQPAAAWLHPQRRLFLARLLHLFGCVHWLMANSLRARSYSVRDLQTGPSIAMPPCCRALIFSSPHQAEPYYDFDAATELGSSSESEEEGDEGASHARPASAPGDKGHGYGSRSSSPPHKPLHDEAAVAATAAAAEDDGPPSKRLRHSHASDVVSAPAAGASGGAAGNGHATVSPGSPKAAAHSHAATVASPKSPRGTGQAAASAAAAAPAAVSAGVASPAPKVEEPAQASPSPKRGKVATSPGHEQVAAAPGPAAPRFSPGSPKPVPASPKVGPASPKTGPASPKAAPQSPSRHSPRLQQQVPLLSGTGAA